MSLLIGKKAPNFTAPAALGSGEILQEYNLHENIRGKYALLFFYPLNFTFVCPTELISLDRHLEKFQALDVEVLTVSVDSHFAHHQWKAMPINQGGIGPVRYTMISDLKREISQDYSVLAEATGVAYRGAFLIDRDGIIRSQIINDLPLGRNTDELLRLVEALKFVDEHGEEVCPADWKKGEPTLTASQEGIKEYLSTAVSSSTSA